jgi:hypothetical protein
MALTTKVTRFVGPVGNQFLRLVRVTADASYPAGGYPFTKSQLGMANLITSVIISGNASTTGASPTTYDVRWDNITNPAAPKLRFFVPAGTEVVAASSLAGVTCDMEVYGS